MNDWSIGPAARRWWRAMNLPVHELQSLGIVPAGSKQRAVLRRAATIDAACMTEGFRALWQMIPSDDGGKKPVSIEACAAIALVLSRVQQDTVGLSLAVACGKERDSKRLPVSEMRFARVQSARNVEELATRLKRLLPLIENQVDVARLAQDINAWYWQKASRRPVDPSRRIEMRWAMEYYGANEPSVNQEKG